MTTIEFLSQLNPDRVEQHRFLYQGRSYPVPYQTVFINGEEIAGLREMKSRFDLLKGIMDENSVKYTDYLDIGCNLSYFPYQFSKLYKNATGVEYDSYYINLARQLYPHLNLIQNDLNQKRLKDLFPGQTFECITSLSMFEYVSDKRALTEDLYNLSTNLVIVEGHSLDINSGRDNQYEAILKSQPWTVTRLETLTDNGINAPAEAKGRPVWVCKK